MEDSGNWFSQGVTLFESKNYPDAITAFDKAIAFNQFPVDAWFNRGLVYAEMGKFKTALDSFDQTLLLDPGYENANIARTMVLKRIKNMQDTTIEPYTSAPPQRTSVTADAVPGSVPSPGTVPIRSPLLAVIFSFIFPGWGQWYNGRRWDGLYFFGALFILGITNLVLSILLKFNHLVFAVFIILGLGLWSFGMYNAYTTAEKINRNEIEFTRKSRLFWLPVAVLVAMIALLIASFALAFFVFGMAGNIAHATTKVVALTAIKPDSQHIVVTYQGGQDADQLRQVTITVTDSSGNSQTGIIGQSSQTTPVVVDSSTQFTGEFLGKTHVVAIGKFSDNTEQMLLNTYLG
jgi:tetratricopeptide (TPR) repeat protein